MHNEDTKEKTTQRIENLKRIKNKIVVMSGKGGVGKSTVSVNLSYALAALGYKVGIMDIDFHGPSIAKMTGVEGIAIEVNKAGRPLPIPISENIYVLSIASLLQSGDDAVVWRGPMKMGVIKQFFEDFEWPELDYLVVDCPPGTGDEPLSVIQTIGMVTGTVIVSTPQDIAFLDARKSISFAKQLSVPILGIVENMSGFICPKCGEKMDLFKTGGAEKAAKDFRIDILEKVPFETEIVESGDSGKPFVDSFKNTEVGQIFAEIARKVIEKIDSLKKGNNKSEQKVNEQAIIKERIAVPVDGGVLSGHFGHAEIFTIYDIENGKIINKEDHTPPPHEPGVIPKWLNEVKATKILTGGIGQAAINFFTGFGIDVLSGAPEMSPDDLIERYLKNEVTFSGATCNHNHGDHDHNAEGSCQ